MIVKDQWLQFKSKDLIDYSFKYSVDEKHLFFVTDLKNVYSSAVRQGNLASSCPGLEGTDECLLETIFDKVTDPEARASFKHTPTGQHTLEISSQMRDSVEKTTFQLKHFNELGVEGVHFHLIAPLIRMQAELRAREDRLMEIIGVKDLAIAEFKASGANILASIDTSTFNEEQLSSVKTCYNSLNYALEQSGSLYTKALMRSRVKVEADVKVSSEDKGKRTRKKFDEVAVQQQEKILSSVMQSTARIVPNKKTKVQI